MKTNAEGIALIKRFEGLRLKAYRCPAGIWTIGYGHTSAAGLPKVQPGMTITETEASEILVRDLATFEAAVAAALTRQVNSNQFSALVSFAYNVGVGAFRRSSVLKEVNAGNFGAISERLKLWVKANGKALPGLVRRRTAEAELFAKPVASAPPAVKESLTPAAPPGASYPTGPTGKERLHVPPAVPPAPHDEPVLRPPADTLEPDQKPGSRIAGWVLAVIAALVAAAAAFIAKGN